MITSQDFVDSAAFEKTGEKNENKNVIIRTEPVVHTIQCCAKCCKDLFASVLFAYITIHRTPCQLCIRGMCVYDVLYTIGRLLNPSVLLIIARKFIIYTDGGFLTKKTKKKKLFFYVLLCAIFRYKSFIRSKVV